MSEKLHPESAVQITGSTEDNEASRTVDTTSQKRDPRLDVWIDSLDSSNLQYAGTDGLQQAFQAAVCKIDDRLKVTVSRNGGYEEGRPMPLYVDVSFEGIILVGKGFTAREVDLGVIISLSLTPVELQNVILARLNSFVQ